MTELSECPSCRSATRGWRDKLWNDDRAAWIDCQDPWHDERMAKQEQDAWDGLERQVRFWRGAYMNERNLAGDLRRHLRDRDTHIANLEAELMPHIGHEVNAGEQVSLSVVDDE